MKSILFLGGLESKRKWIPCRVACKNTLNPQMADLMHQHQHQQHTIQFKITIRFYGNENCIQVVLNLSPRLIQIHDVPLGWKWIQISWQKQQLYR